MHITLDGFAAGPNGEMNWIKLDDEMFDFVKAFTDKADMALYGRKTWEMMDSYWPTAGSKPDATTHDREHSEWYNRVDKIVLSKTHQGKNIGKTTFLDDNIAERLKQIKAQKGKDIMIFGSPGASQILIQNNLIDEYWLFVNSVILGGGIRLFPTLDKPASLKLNSSKLFSCGVIALNYLAA